MSVSAYDVSVPVFRQTLEALSGVLGKAIDHCQSKGVDPAVVISTRLYPDMHPLPFQVTHAIDFAMGAVATLRGVDAVKVGDIQTLPALRKAVDEAVVALDGLKREDFEGAAERELVRNRRGETVRYSGLGYLMSSVMPNFYFHATTAYDLLRHQGVEIGKRDFLGKVQTLA